jgi:hypothetical protein
MPTQPMCDACFALGNANVDAHYVFDGVVLFLCEEHFLQLLTWAARQDALARARRMN